MMVVATAMLALIALGVAALVITLHRRSHQEQAKGISYRTLWAGTLVGCLFYGAVSWVLTALVFGELS